MCINEKVKSLTSNAARTAQCRVLTTNNQCIFHKGVKQGLINDFLDIENLVQLGTKHQACPYYLSRNELKDANIVSV